jgi:CheY-like chemotaxis protein
MTVNLLIIEDDPEIADLLKRYLSRKGFDLAIETSGEAGVSRFRRDEFHVVLCDGLLPKGNGFFVAKEIRASPGGQNVGLVMMSAAYRSAGARREASEAGFDAYYAKPFVVADVSKSLEDLALKYAGERLVPQSQRPIRGATKSVSTAAAGGSSKTRRVAAAPPPPRTASRSSNTTVPADATPVAKTIQPDPPRAAPTEKSRVSPEIAKAVPAEKPTSIENQSQTVQLLLDLARSQLDGTLVLRDNDTELELSWKQGVIVAATDNMRETALGERMCRVGILQYEDLIKIRERSKEERERFAEAALALGLLDVNLGNEQINAQLKERVQRAIAWHRGTATVFKEEAAGPRVAWGGENLQDAILTQYLSVPDLGEAQRELQPKLGQSPQPTRDFENGLIAFARLRPMSALPGYLMGGRGKLSDIINSQTDDAYCEIFAMWRAGLIYFAGEAMPKANIPSPPTEENVPTGDVDQDAAKKIKEQWLKNVDRNHYDVLQISPTATKDVIRRSILSARARFGETDLGGKNLGPTRVDARRLWAILEHAEHVLMHDGRRDRYDSKLARRVKGTQHDEAEGNYIRGRILLIDKQYANAREAFVAAVIKRPGDVDALAFLGWTTILIAKLPPERGMALLEAATALNPQAVRPYFFLGLAAFRNGAYEESMSLMVQAIRRCPDDTEITSAIEILKTKLADSKDT